MKRDLFLSATALSSLLAVAGSAIAAERSFECRLYLPAEEPAALHESAAAGRTLEADYRSGYCVFADGRIAEKQWVFANSYTPDGTSGIEHGYSVYNFDDGDTLMAAYEGGWDEKGFSGTYEVLGGTGAYEGASGTGTITDVESPWADTFVVDIAFEVTLPDS